MRGILTVSIAALAMAAMSPLHAQDAPPPSVMMAMQPSDGEEPTDEEEMAEAMAMLGAMFAVEPLTAEQEARLPLATRVVAKLMPEGAMAEMMDGMLDGMFGKIMEMADANAAKSVLAEHTGLQEDDLAGLSDAEAEELASLYDPAWRERKEVEKAMLPDIMATMMGAMEPGMRKAMSEIYAIHFTAPQLAEIDAFFSTETGGTFARKSFTMASDPRVMAATMEAFPAMMGAIAELEAKQKSATAHLPPVRKFSELSPAEKARIAEATGYTVEDFELMEQAAEAGAAAEDAEEATGQQ